MKIAGFQKVTLLDYPSKIAAIIFTTGCNLKCPFCHNGNMIEGNNHDNFEEEEIIEYLQKRKKVLDGLVISGGEPTIQKDLKKFIQKVKELGLLVKLDTNGTNPDVLENLINNNLVDYVAMDIKSSSENYEKICGKKVDINKIKQSINILKKSNIEYEFRTTISKEYHNLNVIKDILKTIGNNCNYYIQNVEITENVIDKTLNSFSDSELRGLQKELLITNNNIKFRNLYNEI